MLERKMKGMQEVGRSQMLWMQLKRMDWIMNNSRKWSRQQETNKNLEARLSTFNENG